jgi:hypothetical protein
MRTRKRFRSWLGFVGVAAALSGCGSSAPAVETSAEDLAEFRVDDALAAALVAQNLQPLESCVPETLRAIAEAAARSGRRGMAQKLDESFEARFSGSCTIRVRSAPMSPNPSTSTSTED